MTREEFAAQFKDWEHITFEYGRWTATHRNYDCSWEGYEDGWVSNGLLCEGRTLEELAAEIAEKEAEMTARRTRETRILTAAPRMRVVA